MIITTVSAVERHRRIFLGARLWRDLVSLADSDLYSKNNIVVASPYNQFAQRFKCIARLEIPNISVACCDELIVAACHIATDNDAYSLARDIMECSAYEDCDDVSYKFIGHIFIMFAGTDHSSWKLRHLLNARQHYDRFIRLCTYNDQQRQVIKETIRHAAPLASVFRRTLSGARRPATSQIV